MDKQRRGPWSRDDKDFIAENHHKMPVKDIALALKRNVDAVRKYIDENYKTGFQQMVQNVQYNITASPIWKDIQRQFSDEECDMFLYHWGRVISQFKDDVLPTEELQVIDTIKLEILMNRSLKQEQQNIEDIKNLESNILAEKSKDKADWDRDYIASLEQQIYHARAAQESLNRNYKEMLVKKNSILKEMKATRDARIKNIESSKENFGNWVKSIFNNKELKKKVGHAMEKMRLAAEKEYKYLSEYHEYIDGEVDQPILNYENLIDDNKQGDVNEG